MSLAASLPHWVSPGQALLFGAAVALVATLVVMPRVIRKLLGAGISGKDRNKPDRPTVAEMGGIGVFLGFYTGVFALLAVTPLPVEDESLILVALITVAGAAMTGIVDDLVELRQRFKAFIPVVFAAPLALYLPDTTIAFPLVGDVDFGLAYSFLLVPLGIACAANSFNMLEGYNGLGAGLGIIMTVALGLMIWTGGDRIALVLLLPFLGAQLAFLWFNKYPARVFPGDTMTLMTGAVLAAAAMLGKVEFWGALLFIPHIIEFFLKARGGFRGQNFARTVTPRPRGPPHLSYDGPTESLTHIALKRGMRTEPSVAAAFWAVEAGLALLVVGGFWILG